VKSRERWADNFTTSTAVVLCASVHMRGAARAACATVQTLATADVRCVEHASRSRTTLSPDTPVATPVVNRLLAGLPARARNAVLESCERIELTSGDVLSEPAEAIRYAYFPGDGFISLVANVHDHTNLEIGLVGNEGMLSPSSAFGLDVSPLRALVQGSGGALRMKTADLRRAADASAPLRDTLNRYMCAVTAELAQNAVCNRFHVVGAQLARWLLMTHDRAHTDELALTHGLLASMLGVRRSGISVAAAALQADKAIRYSRGAITILDRGRLEGASCECYGVTKEMYRQYLG
jgi:CRP-like cAMP-binding protein